MNRALSFALLSLLFLLSGCSDDSVPQQSVASSSDQTRQNILYFTPLPYAGQQQGTVLYSRNQLPDQSRRYWQFETFELPGYARIDLEYFIDTQDLPSGAASFRIPQSNRNIHFQRYAVWLHIRAVAKPVHQATPSWLPFMLRTDINSLLKADKKRRSRLAEKLAEKAYFFGYATNDDALK